MNNLSDKEELLKIFYDSIIEEIELYPCLGLVSKENSGCHNDMDYNLFILSSEIFKPLFSEIYDKQYEIETFNDLKKIGFKYENEMFKITKGINTQKGLIFCASIFFFSYLKTRRIKSLKKFIIKFCKPLRKAVRENNNSIGDGLYFRNKIRGAKFEALNGYSVVFKALKFYEKKVRTMTISENIKLFTCLIFIMFNIDDTTLINKVGIEKYKLVKNDGKKVLNQILNAKLDVDVFKYNKLCIENNISPGGTADLVVLLIFLIKIK